MRAKPDTRYTGRPLIALLEMFVLEYIGELDPKRRALAQKLVHSTWGKGNWLEVTRKQLKIKEGIGDYLKKKWRENLVIAREKNLSLTPNDFAVAIVDANWSQHIDPSV
ncbi:MAG TPA: hypothetical protein VKX17_21470 [Planctomycetota bacterium]|nr:hypothetical protein [Planctomycetota bacterium]